MSNNAKGSCLCGGVTITASKPVEEFGVCHCSMCRKWGSGPFMETEFEDGVTIDGEENISTYSSSEWAERGFCKNCGTNLFYRLKETGKYHMALGIFGDDVDPKFTMQVFIDKKPDNYAFANETATLTEAQIFEMFAPKDG